MTTAREQQLDAAREVMKTALTVLCAARNGQSWSINMDRDFDIAIDGIRAALALPVAPPVETELVERLRERARDIADTTRRIADSKAERNRAAGDIGAAYAALRPEDTTEWKAADAIERLSALPPAPVAADVVERVKEDLEEICRLHKPFPDPGAHSWEAWGRAVFAKYNENKRTAQRARAAIAAYQQANADPARPSDISSSSLAGESEPASDPGSAVASPDQQAGAK